MTSSNSGRRAASSWLRISNALGTRHRRLAKVWPRGYHPYRVRGGWIYLDVRESPMMLARALWAYEPSKVAALTSLLPEGGTFIDVGANKGDFTILAADTVGPTGRVLALEPESTNVEWLTRSVERNRFNNVTIEAAAASDHVGEATLFLGKTSGHHSLVTEPKFSNSTGTTTVPVRPLDDIVAAHGITSVDVIKIDVEGAEEQVLRGASALLSGNAPMVILLDLHPWVADVPACLAILESHGFNLRDPDNFVLPLRIRDDSVHELVAIR